MTDPALILYLAGLIGVVLGLGVVAWVAVVELGRVGNAAEPARENER